MCIDLATRLNHKVLAVALFLIITVSSAHAQDQTVLSLPVTKQELAVSAAALAVSLTYDAEISQALRVTLPAGISWAPEALSALASEAGVVALHAVMYSQDKELAWRSAKATATALAATYVLKTALGRERPDVPGSQGKFHGLSFSDDLHSMPSGHTTAAFAMARVLADHDPKHAALYYTGASLVGLSRINLARHWPSDVVAGALIGLAVGSHF